MDMKNAFKLLENILFIISWKIFCMLAEKYRLNEEQEISILKKTQSMWNVKVKC